MDWNTFTAFATKDVAEGVVLGGLIGVLIAIGIFILILVVAVLYIYFAFAWMTIAKKMKHKRPWLAWVPFANISMWLQMGGFHWALIFLLLIPVLGWIAVAVLWIIAHWRVFEKLKYPGWLSLAPILDVIGYGLGTVAYGIIIGIVAWKKGESQITQMKKMPKKRKKK